MATTAGTKYAAQKLLVLEGRIPSQGVLCSSNFHFWQQWRRSVEQAQTPSELTPQVSHPRCKRTGNAPQPAQQLGIVETLMCCFTWQAPSEWTRLQRSSVQ